MDNKFRIFNSHLILDISNSIIQFNIKYDCVVFLKVIHSIQFNPMIDSIIVPKKKNENGKDKLNVLSSNSNRNLINLFILVHPTKRKKKSESQSFTHKNNHKINKNLHPNPFKAYT